MNALRIDQPQPGHYATRLVRKGPLVPARIWLSDGRLHAELNGKAADPYRLWPSVMGRPITEVNYRFMVQEAVWCRTYAPHEPPANPESPIDLGKMPAIF